jgi:hypothetical protein
MIIESPSLARRTSHVARRELGGRLRAQDCAHFLEDGDHGDGRSRTVEAGGNRNADAAGEQVALDLQPADR